MFSVNLTDSTIKILLIKRVQTCHVVYKGPGCYHSASKTLVRERIF